MGLEWTFSNLAIQTVTGLLGAHVAATAVHEHRFGFVGHSLVGVIAGALSGYFLQRMVMTTVTGNGDVMPASDVEIAIVQALAGVVIGGIAMLVIGFIRHEMASGEKSLSERDRR